MDRFALSSPAERQAYIQEAASRRDLASTIIEKDFWVCWTLKRLSEHSDLGPFLTFKGGTSLSKAYGIIDRFSEDIDLTIAREAPFIRETEAPMDAPSGKQRKIRTKALADAARRYVADAVMPALQSVIAKALGTTDGWLVRLDGNDTERQTLLFQYPRLETYGHFTGGYGGGAYGEAAFGEGAGFEPSYIRPQIKLEFGARGENDPSEVREFLPYLAEVFPDVLPDAVWRFPTLAVERTFWEKATILHALYHSGKIRDRLSRHYYDLHMLVKRGIAERAIAMPDLLAQVVRNKTLMFPEPAASYDTAVIGQLKLVPGPDGMDSLQRDYFAMEEMFMGQQPSFDEVISSLTALEAAINGQTAQT
jgi:hypothetical protein